MNKDYIITRIGRAVFTFWAVITISFGMIRLLPGDAEAVIRAMMAREGGGAANPDQLTTAVESKPIYMEYIDYWINLVQGDLGTSLFFDKPVVNILVNAFPWTLFVVSVSLVLVFGIGITLGAFLAYTDNKRIDVGISTIATFLNSVPYYVLAFVLVYVAGYQSNWFPAGGRLPSGVEPGFTSEFLLGAVHHAILPIISIVVTAFGFRALAMRSNSLQVLGSDYLRAAKVRGLSRNRIALEYVGRNAVLPLYTELMIAIGALMGGSIIIETIFEYQGLGWYFYMAINSRDYPLMMGAFIVIGATVTLGLFIADLTYGFIDPRASTGNDDSRAKGSRSSIGTTLIALTYNYGNRIRRLFNLNSDGERPFRNPKLNKNVEGTIFQRTSEIERNRRARFKRGIQEYVIAPMHIILSDMRARVGGAILIGFVLMGTVGPIFVPQPNTNQGPRRVGLFVNMNHPLGTNNTGTDLLSQVIWATPDMLEMMMTGAVIATIIATVIGILAGYYRGSPDRFLMLLADVMLTIPGLPLLMVLAVIFSPTEPWAVGILLTANAWGGTARQIRSQVLPIGREAYVEASGIMSLSLPTIMIKDILPVVAPFVFVRFVLMARRVVLSSVALYFLGVLPFTVQNWGVMLNIAWQQGALLSFNVFHWILIPVVPIVLITYGLVLFGQGAERIFNPRIRSRHTEIEKSEPTESTSDGVSTGGD